MYGIPKGSGAYEFDLKCESVSSNVIRIMRDLHQEEKHHQERIPEINKDS